MVAFSAGDTVPPAAGVVAGVPVPVTGTAGVETAVPPPTGVATLAAGGLVGASVLAGVDAVVGAALGTVVLLVDGDVEVAGDPPHAANRSDKIIIVTDKGVIFFILFPLYL